jgi:Ca2+-binding EF-hand superfamily protein
MLCSLKFCILNESKAGADEMESIFSEFDKDNNGFVIIQPKKMITNLSDLKLVMKEVDETLSDADITGK